jgi:hypothetical protein
MFGKLKKQFEDFGDKIEKEKAPKLKKPAIIVEMEKAADYFPNEEDNDNPSK